MIGSASAVPACARAVDAGRRTPKGSRAGCPAAFGGWRSGAAERVQAGAGDAEIGHPPTGWIGTRSSRGSSTQCSVTVAR
jgi:hypothetical protein